ncbi:MAG: hypothetical protein ACR2NZ_23575 [Rubripirellula sp.]
MNAPANTPSDPTTSSRAIVPLVAYIILLSGIAFWAATSTSLWEHLQWESNAANWVVMAAEHLGVLILRDVVLFLPLAFLTAAALSKPHGKGGWMNVFLITSLAFAVSLALSLLMKSIMAGIPLHAPSIFVIASLVVICAFGSWAGATWVHLHRVGQWLLLQLFSALIVVATLLLLVGRLGLQTEPANIASTPVQSRERIELVRRIQQHAPHRLEPGDTTKLTLSQQDLNKLITWGLSILPREQNASMEIRSDLVTLSFSEVMPRIPVFDHVLNVRIAAVPLTKRGELGLAPREIVIGHLKIPEWLLRWSGPIIVDKDWHNDATEPFFAALKSIDVQDGQVTVAYGHLKLPDGFLSEALAGIGVMDDIGPTMAIHVEHLVEFAEQNQTLTFQSCVQAAFSKAQQRSANGQAVRENRGALLALGYLLGHHKIRRLAGSKLPEVPAAAAAKFGRVTLHDRQDWTRHFSVSAALQVLSTDLASNAIGLLKEELDLDGGSGFSFADLMADHSGTRLAKVATESEASAIQMQRRLSQPFPQDAIMPDASDLPEGMQHSVFVEKFGDIDDPRYQAIVGDIDRRIAGSAIYQ